MLILLFWGMNRDRWAFELLVTAKIEDVVVEVLSWLDAQTLRHVAQVSRTLHACALVRLARYRFFYTTWHIRVSTDLNDTLRGHGASFWSINRNNSFLSKEKLLASLGRDYPTIPKERFLIGPVMEIDQTDECSRSFYIPAKNQPPLMPIAYARARAKEQKRREMFALFEEWAKMKEGGLKPFCFA
jgi:hypothetical protein